MEKLNTLIKVALEGADIEKAFDTAPRRGAIGVGALGGGTGALLGLGIGGLTHLLKSDKGLSQEARRQRLKSYLRRGTLIGGGIGLGGGAYAGYRTGRAIKGVKDGVIKEMRDD
jgi:hypothetical protein